MLFKRKQNRKLKSRPLLYRMQRSTLEWFKLVGNSAAVIIFVVGGYHFFSHSSYFQISQIEVRGEHPHISEKVLIDLADISLGKNIFSVNLYQVGQNIKKISWVKDVQVRRHFPEGISLWVSEYKPVALLATTNSPLMEKSEISTGNFSNNSWLGLVKNVDFYYMSEEGLLFKKLSTADDFNFPVITGFEKEALEKFPGYYGAKMKMVMDFYRHYQNSKASASFMPIGLHYDVSSGMEAFVVHRDAACQAPDCYPLRVYFGMDGYEAKLSSLAQFVPFMTEQGQIFRSLDLHVPGKIFARI